MLPSITFFIKAFKNNSDKLLNTIQSIANTGYFPQHAGIVCDKESINIVGKIINQSPQPNKTPKIFNKFPLGVPTFCFGFGEGKIKEADALNAVINQTNIITDIYIVLDSGDEISYNLPNTLINKINQAPDIIGFIYSDYIKNGLRIYNDPYTKENLLYDKLGINNFCFLKNTLNLFQPKDTELNFIKDLSNKFMGMHISEPLFTKV